MDDRGHIGRARFGERDLELLDAVRPDDPRPEAFGVLGQVDGQLVTIEESRFGIAVPVVGAIPL